MRLLYGFLLVCACSVSFAGDRRPKTTGGQGDDQANACFNAKASIGRANINNGTRVVKMNPCECRSIDPLRNNGNSVACSIDHIVEKLD